MLCKLGFPGRDTLLATEQTLQWLVNGGCLKLSRQPNLTYGPWLPYSSDYPSASDRGPWGTRSDLPPGWVGPMFEPPDDDNADDA